MGGFGVPGQARPRVIERYPVALRLFLSSPDSFPNCFFLSSVWLTARCRIEFLTSVCFTGTCGRRGCPA